MENDEIKFDFEVKENGSFPQAHFVEEALKTLWVTIPLSQQMATIF